MCSQVNAITCPGFPGYCSESFVGQTCVVVCAAGRPNVPLCQVSLTLGLKRKDICLIQFIEFEMFFYYQFEYRKMRIIFINIHKCLVHDNQTVFAMLNHEEKRTKCVK